MPRREGRSAEPRKTRKAISVPPGRKAKKPKGRVSQKSKVSRYKKNVIALSESTHNGTDVSDMGSDETTDPDSESHSSEAVGDSDTDDNFEHKRETLAVHVGNSFKSSRYKVHRKLGWGAFSTVWLAWDTQDQICVALKIQNNARDCTLAAQAEIKILKEIGAGDPEGRKGVVKLLDHFDHKGPNGRHICMVFEFLGDNLLTLIKHTKYKGLPLHIVKELAKNILVGLHYLHQLNIIHTDLKPENILLMSPLDPNKDPRLSDSACVSGNRQSTVPASIPVLGAAMLSRDHKKKQLKRKDKKDGKIVHEPEVLDTEKGLNIQESTVLPPSGDGREIVGAAPVADLPETSMEKLEIKPSIPVQVGDDHHKLKKARSQVTFIDISPKRASGQRSAISKDLIELDTRCKIVDLGTSCWTYRQYTQDIQTRPYRCPEVLLRAKYSTSADMWSFACLIFELATGNVLFDPRTGGDEFSRDEDHLAQIMQVLGPIPRKMASRGHNSNSYFTRHGDLHRIKGRDLYPLQRLFVEAYKFVEHDARELADFLSPLLNFMPKKRPSAGDCMQHPWLNHGLISSTT